MRHRALTCSALVPVAALLAVATWATPAWSADFHPRLELGGFVGAHIFSDRNELGTVDVDPPANSLRNSAIPGVRVGLEFLPRLAVEAELGVIPTVTRVGEGDVAVMVYRAHALYRFLDGRIQPFLLAGIGGYTAISDTSLALDDTDPAFHAGIGAKAPLGESYGVRLDGLMLLPPSSKPDTMVTLDWEVTGSFYVVLWAGPKDRDGDGLLDDQDQCPKQAGPRENNGCPDRDTDGDGFVDRLDKCFKEAGIKELDGCPDRDPDSDGIVDRFDKCPSEPGIKELQGCPDTDKDGDGIVDRLDKCVDQPGVKELEGCPDTDKDGDGVVDRLDKCIDEAGPKENHGCPLPVEIKKFTGAIKGITFKRGSAKIRPQSFKVLDQAVAVLKEFPHLPLEIAGHTSSEGKREKNVELSKARAEAVKAYLVSKGVEESRIHAVGFGPDQPVADNKSRKGRRANRRIEFHVKAN